MKDRKRVGPDERGGGEEPEVAAGGKCNEDIIWEKKNLLSKKHSFLIMILSVC